MLKKGLLSTIALITALSVAHSSFAGGPDDTNSYVDQNQESTSGFYIGGHGGVAIPSGEYAYLIKTGLNLGLQVGYHFDTNVRVELAMDYMENAVRAQYAGISNEQVNWFTFMLNGYYDFHITDCSFTPFIGLGIGTASANASASLNGGTIISQSETRFAYQGILGFNVPLSHRVTLGADYRFLNWTNDGTHQNILEATLNYYL